MNQLEQLKAELKQMKRKGRFVVSLTYIIDRLESIERHDNESDGDLPINQSGMFARLLEIRKGGEENRTLSKVD